MRRFFVKNLLFIITVNVLIKPVWVFFIDRKVQNILGHQQYGSYPPLLNIALILQIILDFGLTNYNNRTIAQHPEKLKTLFPAMLSARLALMLIYIGIATLAAYVLGHRGWDLLLLLGILFIQIFNTLLLFIRSNVSALLKFKADGMLSVTDKFLMIVICSVLLIYPATAHNFKLEWFIEAQIVSYALACIIAFYVLKRISKLKFHFSFDKELLTNVIRESWPYALLVFLMSIYMRADMIMLDNLCGAAGKDQVSIYMSAYRLLDISNNMSGLMFAGVLLPLFGRMLIQKANVFPIIQTSVNILLPCSFIVAVAASFWGVPVMHRLYTAATDYDGSVFAWVMTCFPFFCITYIYSTLLTSNGNLGILNKIALAGVVVNLSLNFFLIPRYFALGAAISSSITQAVVALCYIMLAGKTFSLPLPIKWVLTHFLFLVIILILAYAIHILQFNWMLQVSLFVLLSITSIPMFRFVSVKAVKQLLASKQ